MRVVNNTPKNIKVAVNQWGSTGDTSYFDIEPFKNETWSRTDERGFVMALNKNNTDTKYYVHNNSEIVVYDGYVADGDKRIDPVT